MPNINKKTKIVATLGPATKNEKMIFRLAKAGVNVFRINLSHQPIKEVEQLVKSILAVEKKVGRPIGILADLAGPKIRISEVKESRMLRPGEPVTFVAEGKNNNSDVITVNYKSALKNIKKGVNIFLGDGNIILEVKEKTPKKITTEVIVGGSIRSHMGFTAQGIELINNRVSIKDKEAIKALAHIGITAFAVSFVQTPEDIYRIRKLVTNDKQKPMVFAKIETSGAVENIEKIIDAADGVLIGRGDLGLSIPMEQIPALQKKIISLALQKTKPVITATQMLESMTFNPIPTRAEIADVAHAIIDGTDAVMLSGETAVGKYPEKVIQMASAIIEETEANLKQRDFTESEAIADAVSASAVRAALQVNAKLIIVLTESGKTAQRISRHRSHTPVLAVSNKPLTARKLTFSWGVYPRLEKDADVHSFNELIKETKKLAKKNRVTSLEKGDIFVICAGVPFRKTGTTNLVIVEIVE